MQLQSIFYAMDLIVLPYFAPYQKYSWLQQSNYGQIQKQSSKYFFAVLLNQESAQESTRN